MRLSEKGCVHLNEWMVHRLPIEAFEFKPEDFTNCVVLTVREAKVFTRLMDAMADYGEVIEIELLSKGSRNNASIMRQRIEQAEKKK